MNNGITIGVVKNNSGSKVITTTYEQLYDLLIQGKLTPNAWYRFPYRSVNFLNGWTNANNNENLDLEGYEARQIHISEEEILRVQAVSSFQLSETCYSEKFPQDIIRFQPYTNKLGVNLDISNGSILPNETEVENFDLKFDGTNVYFNMPAGYPAHYGHYFYLYAEFENIINQDPIGGEIGGIESELSFPDFNGVDGGFTGLAELTVIGFPVPNDSEVLITTNGSGNGARMKISYYGINSFQLSAILENEIYCFGNSYREGDEIYFSLGSQNFTYTLTSSNIDLNTQVFEIKENDYTTTSSLGYGATFVILITNEGESRPYYKVNLVNSGSLFENGDLIFVEKNKIGENTGEIGLNIIVEDATPITTVSNNNNYYQDGCFEPLTPAGVCQYPYTSDEPSYNYGKAMSRIKLAENGTKVILVDLTEEDFNNYVQDTLYVQHIEALADTYGWIISRNDTEKSISMPIDWRNFKYRRWKCEFAENTGLSVDYFYIPSAFFYIPEIFDYKDFLIIGNEIYSQESLSVKFSDSSIGGADGGWWYQGNIENFVFLGDVKNSNFGTSLKNSTFGSQFMNNEINDCYNSIFGFNVQRLKVEGFIYSIIGNSSNVNEIFYVGFCVLGENFKANKMYGYSYNKNFAGNEVVKQFFQKQIFINENNEFIVTYINNLNQLQVETL